MLLIKNANIYAPTPLGQKDVLICGDKIELIAEKINIGNVPCQVIDAKGKYLIPGLIDQHVHITGGGGEGGFHTRAPEIQLSELILGGITTVVGLLGTDGSTRSVENLYAKTMALNEEGITAYMLTGAYSYPGPSITGDQERDILYCEKVIGIKVALSDHRSSNLTSKELIALGSKARLAGMLSGKAGILVIHMGSGKRGLKSLLKALDNSDIPIGIFRPTHMGRSKKLREEGMEYLKMGGYVDLTCSSRHPGTPSNYIANAIAEHIPLEHITISSDGHGSWSTYDKNGNLLEMGVAGVDSMLCELRHMVQQKKIPLETALPFFTSNVAAGLALSGTKGIIREGADADILLLDEKLNLDTTIAKGSPLLLDGKLLKKGTYE